MPTIQHVKFHTPIDYWEPGGTEDWTLVKYGPTSRFPVEVIDKGNSLHFVWIAPPSNKNAGKTCRARVPLTNIAGVYEIDDDAKETKK